MNEKIKENYLFHSGYAINESCYIFIAHYLPAQNKGIGISEILLLESKKWHTKGRFKWQASGMLTSDHSKIITLLGRDGEIAYITDSKTEETKLPGIAIGPTCGICYANEIPLVFGMKREIFKQNTDSSWALWNQGMNPAPPQGLDISSAIKFKIENSGGIKSVSTQANGEIYAFGLKGEIWIRRTEDNSWTPIDSPTNLSIADTTTDTKGTIFACGQSGVLLKGTNQNFEPIQYEGVQNLDFCSIDIFNEQLYIADGHSLRRLIDNQLEDPIDFGVNAIVPSSQISSSNGILLSIAGSEIFASKDGDSWQSLL
jgi:hypothetical protein